MGTTRIKVIDLSAETEQIKTSRKRAQTAAVDKIKKPLIKERKVKEKPVKEEPEAVEKLEQTAQPQVIQEQKVEFAKKTQKVRVSKPKAVARGKKYQNAKLLLDPERFYPVDTALELVKKVNLAQFDASCEAHIVVKQKGLRGFATLPNPIQKQTKILVFTTRKDGLGQNGVTLGTDATIEEIEEKKLIPKKDFSLLIAEPSFMPKLAKLGKILGPVGLMPNPKTGTVTDKPAEVIKKFGAGAIEFKTENEAPVIHTVIGKISQTGNQLKENLAVLIKAIGLPRIEKLYLTPTMGPSVKVDLSSLVIKT